MAMPSKRFWEREGGRIALRHNLGWWLSEFLRFGVFLCVGASCLLLLVRKADVSAACAWGALAAGLLGCAIFSAVRLRAHWFSRRDGLVRLDERMRLHNRLISAVDGVGDFPEPRETDSGWRWHWRRIGLPVAGSAVLLMVAAWVPLGAPVDATASVQVPPAWEQVQTWMNRVEEERIVDQEGVEKIREKLEALKDQPQEDWYGHESLEAGEHLREQSAESLRKLQRDLQTAASALSAMQEFGDGLSAKDLQQLDGALSEALEGLELGNLPLNKEMLSDLKSIDPKSLGKFSKEQLRQMSERLRNGAMACKECVGLSLGEGEMALLLQQPGGGVERGPGSVPLNLNSEKTDLGTTGMEGIQTGDMSRALPGETVGLTEGTHEVDSTTYQGPVEAGGVRSPGQGGDAVWRDTLTPAEREALQRFFK